MPEYYYDIEVGFEDDALIERMRMGEKGGFNPRICKIITIQYQRLDSSGRAVSDLTILKEWESSEEDIIRKFSRMLNPQDPWAFIPVGHNIHFDLGTFKERAAKYGMEYDNWFIYHNLPTIDVKPICIALNDFKFSGCGLDKFTGKGQSGLMVPVWYHDKEYDKVVDYVKKEAAEFVKFYQNLKQKMPLMRRHFDLSKK